MAHRHCQDFERAGMPSPAGTGLSRRSFMMRGGALALAVYGGSRLLGLDALQAGVARAALDGGLAPALASASVPVAAVAGPDDYGFWARNVWGPVEDRMLQAIGELGDASAATRDAAIGQAANAARQASQLRQQLAPFAEDG